MNSGKESEAVIRVVVMNVRPGGHASVIHEIEIENDKTHLDPGQYGNYQATFKNEFGEPAGKRRIYNHEKRRGALELVVSAIMGNGSR